MVTQQRTSCARPLPQADQVELAMATLFDTTVSLLDDSQLEDNLEEMLWSLTSLFHRRLTHLQRRLDDHEFEVRESMAVQDASEVASVELERLKMIGLNLWDHRDTLEQMRDLACDHFSAATGSAVDAPHRIKGFAQRSDGCRRGQSGPFVSQTPQRDRSTLPGRYAYRLLRRRLSSLRSDLVCP
jgi:hypothetical protein